MFIRPVIGQSAGGGGGSYLLDTYTSARLAYSVRQLRAAQTLCMRVRRISDDAEQDIGFVDGELDVAALETFCSGTDGRIRTWYDQSGNGDDMVNTTASTVQPLIVSAGSVLLEGLIPRVQFDPATQTGLSVTGATIGLQTRTWSAVWKQDAAAQDRGPLSFVPNGGTGSDFNSSSSFEFQGSNSGASRVFGIFGAASTAYAIQQSGASAAVPHGHYWEQFASSSGTLYQDNSSIGTDGATFDANNTQQLLLGVRFANSQLQDYWNGSIQEFIYWDSDVSADKDEIHTDVSTYFSTPASTLLDSLVSWWALEETSGTRVDSHASNDLDLTNAGSETAVISNGATFNGSGSKLGIASPTGMNSGENSWAFAGWVKLSSTATISSIASVTDSNCSANTNVGMLVDHRSGANRFNCSVYASSTRKGVAADSFGAPSTGTYYFVYAYYDSSVPEVGISINNGTVDTAAATGTLNDKSGAFGLGILGGNTSSIPNYLTGSIDEAAFWNRVLTSAEITELYNAGSGITYTDLFG